MRKAAITTQCGWRVKIARRELLKLKMVSLLTFTILTSMRCYESSTCLSINGFFVFQAAKETGALQDAKNKLEKELEELTSCLELEKQMRVLKLHITFHAG